MRWSSKGVRCGCIALVATAAAASLSACASTQGGMNVSTASIRLDDEGVSAPTAAFTRRPGLASPIAQICAYPGGKQVLDTDLPGLTTRPEYMFFSGMSLKKLQVMSKGQLRDEDLARVDADLRRLP